MEQVSGRRTFPDNSDTVDVDCHALHSIFVRGLIKVIYVGHFLFIGYSVLCEIAPGNDGDTLMLLLPVATMLLFALHFPGGIGRMLSAFAQDCYLRAGPGGVFVRMPRQKIYGRYRVLYWHLEWPQIANIVDYTYRVNGIPMSRELQIRLQDRSRLAIPSY